MNGYNVEEHMVTTEDGYMLTLHRIPNKNLNESKPAVFLGILNIDTDTQSFFFHKKIWLNCVYMNLN